jgi:hypothetical protein
VRSLQCEARLTAPPVEGTYKPQVWGLYLRVSTSGLYPNLPSHYDNCPRCYGFGLMYRACPVCGSNLDGRPRA